MQPTPIIAPAAPTPLAVRARPLPFEHVHHVADRVTFTRAER